MDGCVVEWQDEQHRQVCYRPNKSYRSLLISFEAGIGRQPQALQERSTQHEHTDTAPAHVYSVIGAHHPHVQ